MHESTGKYADNTSMSVVSVDEPAAATKSPSLHDFIALLIKLFLFFLFSNAPALQLRGDTALER